jgi:hypothetical protein
MSILPPAYIGKRPVVASGHQLTANSVQGATSAGRPWHVAGLDT